MARKERPAWWNYVKNILRQYPLLKQKLETPLEPRLGGCTGTPYTLTRKSGEGESALSFDGRPSGPPSSPVERCVIHDLPPREQRRFDAVDSAIRRTQERHPADCKPRLEIIELVYFKGTHTLAGAAIKVGCHPNTASAWQAEFIRMVAQELDLP